MNIYQNFPETLKKGKKIVLVTKGDAEKID
jgi:hypothetical protein